MTPNNSDQAALLPCPFCGSVADHKEWSDAGYHCISCADCDVAMDYFHTKREAIAAWNRRATSQPPALHDELRARHIEVLQTIKTVFAGIPEPCEERAALDYAIAALTLPASEAVAWRWRHPDGDAGTWWDAVPGNDDYKRVALDDGCTIEYAYGTPQAPAAHAGGEAVAVDALRELAEKWRGTAKIDALLARPVAPHHLVNRMLSCADELTALLSGGAAREGK